jgi:predicted transcriptional regulator
MAPTSGRIDYPALLSLKLDDDTDTELDSIALFERKTKSALVRDELVQLVQKYRRTPQYIRFKRQLAEMKPE